MYNMIDKLLFGIWGVWRFRWLALLVAWLIALAGWTIVYKMEHKYLSSARIYVDTNEVLEPLLQGLAIQPNVKDRVALMSKTLLSRPNLEVLIDNSGLSGPTGSAAGRQALISQLEGDINIYDASGSQSLYTINYAHADPAIARQVVASLIDIFVDRNLGEEREDDVAAQRFLDARIVEYEGRLEAAEKRLANFKRRNAGSMPGEAGGYFQRMEAARDKLRTASLSLREVRNRRDELRRQLQNKEPVLVSSNPDYVPQDVARIRSLQDQLDNLRVRYTDRHPQVAQLRETIAELQEARTRTDDTGGSVGERRNTGVPSLAHQQVSTMLAESEARMAELSVRVSQYQSEFDELNATIDSIPQVEARLAQLDRDYATVRDQHTTLLGRREAARLTEAVKEKSDNVTFRVVDPPFVQDRPAIPNKKLLNIAVLVAALGAGAGLAFLLAMLSPVFFHKRGLSMVAGVDVLGAVSLNRSASARLAGLLGTGIYAGLALLLIAVLPGLIMLELRQIDPLQFLQGDQVPLPDAITETQTYREIMDSAPMRALTALLVKP